MAALQKLLILLWCAEENVTFQLGDSENKDTILFLFNFIHPSKIYKNLGFGESVDPRLASPTLNVTE